MGMIPFTINQKQEVRNNNPSVAYISYIDINVFNHQYRLLKRKNGMHVYTIDGIKSLNNYEDKINGVKVYMSGPNLVFSTTFGLTVSWNGDDRVDVVLCDTYSNYVCGFCGNADGVRQNDFLDKFNSLKDSKTNMFYNRTVFKWGSLWRVQDPDNSLDQDGSK